ncbi:MAG: NAD/NADP octopine/nopaline dehydrogenase family protein [Candidatus Bipolaricaulia bacterium]
MKIAVLGAGPGGLAAAAALAHQGFDVNVFNRSQKRIRPVQEAGGVQIDGAYGGEFVPLPVVSDDPKEALSGRQLFMIMTPAYGQEYMARMVIPYLEPGKMLLLCSGSAGSLCVAQLLDDADIDYLDDVLIAETVTLPQSARLVDEASLRIKLPAQLRTAAFPATNTPRAIEFLEGILNVFAAANVFDTGLNNPNFIIHPAPMLLNYAEIERRDLKLSIMNEGMTPGVLRCMDAVDTEKQALLTALEIEPITVDDLYRELGSSPSVYREPGEPMGLRDRIWRRYVEEDVPYGSVMMSSLGSLLGVSTPVCDGINAVLSVVEERDYWTEGRTVDKLGIDGMTRAELITYLQTGKR